MVFFVLETLNEYFFLIINRGDEAGKKERKFSTSNSFPEAYNFCNCNQKFVLERL
ncbi:unnamed protein product [Hymenolepis diminuta]|uniref:Uncharacterized protein n=1 Tax=Hymenolepis diminuta TaxID=6216 RepID=A0A564Y6Q4_HYMDI|nr:unnamed protein product [Hymenolepis diminuta]